jgi:protocatechuate 3,4-dioxygenase beta subunit
MKNGYSIRFITALLIAAAGFVIPAEGSSPGQAGSCKPTPPDMLGPFYKPNAPVRSRVGEGYVVGGVVRTTDCSPLNGARIEFWLAGPDGEYDDDHRATMYAGKNGAYRFASSFPPPYAGRPSHIHIRVSAPGCRTLVTQHYPVPGQRQAAFDLVLEPER